ncbi:hypothetical protein [Microbacterium galbinum]|uniref:hypothetical protein n=1 Tax=Microbacterium galbinum TaxID=2851646 RepID=UPI001FFC485E|nr:hypothetical protein [Microbacterium galbinum]MCK2029884.1 hypothetical protein [Microbacterium galbinum]
MPEATFDNPAGRLWAALDYLRDHGQRSSDQKPIKSRSLLVDYFGIDADDEAAYYDRVSALLRLPVEIRQAVDGLEDPVVSPEKLTRPLRSVQALLSANVTGRENAHRLRVQITDAIMNDLDICSDVLSRTASAVVINDDTLTEIRDAAAELIQAILDDETLPPAVKQTLLRHAHHVLRTVDEYKVAGGEAVVDAWDTLLGAAARNKSHVRPSPRVWAAFKNLGAIVATIVTIASAPESIVNGIAYISDMFAIEAPTLAPGDSPPSEVV